METYEKIKAIIAEGLNCSAEDISREALLKEDLGADSLDAVELIMAIEDEFGITVPKEQAEAIRSVEDIVLTVDSLAQ